MSSVASSSIPSCVRITPNTSTPSSSSYSSSLKLSSTTKPHVVTIRCSQTEGPIRRPVAPPIREPSSSSSSSSPPPPMKPNPPTAKTVAPAPEKSGRVEESDVITLEFQRQKARELQEYFKQKKLEEASNQGPFFGFIGKNEIINGRWAMFGFAVGMLTEYATGSDFVDQVKILLSNFGIIDLE